MNEGLDTVGRRRLVDWLAVDGRSQTFVAEFVEVKQSAVSLWAAGKSRPEAHLRRALKPLIGGTETDWETPEETALVERALAKAARSKSRPRRPATTRTTAAAAEPVKRAS